MPTAMERLKEEVSAIDTIINGFADVEVVRCTNKAYIVRSLHSDQAKLMAMRLNDYGWAVEVRKGNLIPSNRYIRVHYNQKY